MHNTRRLVLFVGRHRRTVFGLVVLPAIILLVYSIDLLSVYGISNTVEQRFIRFLTPQKSPSGDIRLVYMDEEHNTVLMQRNPELQGSMTDPMKRQLWRRLHADLLRKLGGAGARVVAFDLTFPEASDDSANANQLFKVAVGDIASQGKTRIVIGIRLHESIDKHLQEVFTPEEQGSIDIHGDAADTDPRKSLRRIPIAIFEGRSVNGRIEEQLVKPLPMPLLVLACAKQTGDRLITFRMDAGRGDLTLYENGKPTQRIWTEIAFCTKGAQNCEVSEGFEWRRTALLPLMTPSIGPPEEPYESVLSKHDLPDYKDKIVIVGARLPEEEVPAAAVPKSKAGDTLYGYHVHAAALDDLLHDSYPRKLNFISQVLLFYALAGLSFLGRRLLPGTDVKVNTHFFGERLMPLGLLILIVIYAIGGFVFYNTQRLVLNVLYDVLLLAAAYFAFGPKAPGRGTQKASANALQM